MTALLLIIAGIVALAAASFYLHKYSRESYLYNIFSIGGMAVSFIGMIAFTIALFYYKQGDITLTILGVVLGIAPYICMFIRDMRKTSIIIALAALFCRFAISALLVLVILWYVYIRKSSMDEIKGRLRNIERATAV